MKDQVGHQAVSVADKLRNQLRYNSRLRAKIERLEQSGQYYKNAFDDVRSDLGWLMGQIRAALGLMEDPESIKAAYGSTVLADALRSMEHVYPPTSTQEEPNNA